MIICLAALHTGCSRPDTWYDVNELYENLPVAQDQSEVDQSQLPTLEFAEEQPLPEISPGHVALSLEEAVFFSLKRNSELKVQRYSPLIAGTFEQVERGVFDPELFAELSYSEEKASETSRSTEELFSVEGSDTLFETGLRQRLPTGTEAGVSLGYGRSRSNRTPEQQDVRLGLSVTQSLLRGLGPVVNLLDVRQAQLDTRASLYELRGFLEALISEVEITYWRYVLAAQSITIFEESLEIARKQLHEVKNRIEVGAIPRNDAAAASAEVARREQALIEARGIHNDRRLRLLRLLNVTNTEYITFAVEPTSKPETVISPLTDLDGRLRLAVQMRPDLNEARLRHRRQSLEVVRTRNGLLPRLELFLELGKTGYAESFDDSWSNLKEDNYDLLTGIRLDAFMDNRTAKAEHLAAGASRDQAAAAVENLVNLVKVDVLLAANELNRTREQISAGAVTRKLAELTLQAEQERFSVGNATSLLVAQAQRDLLVSQLAEKEAIIEYRIALVNLYLAEGSLLERRGIQLESG